MICHQIFPASRPFLPPASYCVAAVFLAGAFLGAVFLAAALVVAFFFAGAFLPLPVLAAFSAIKATAITMVTSAGSVPLGKVALILAT